MLVHLINSDRPHGVEDITNVTAQAATLGGAGAAVVGHSMSVADWAVVVSMLVAVMGFIVQLALAARIFIRDYEERKEFRANARKAAMEQVFEEESAGAPD